MILGTSSMSSAARASASALTSASAARVRLPWHDETMSARRPKNGTLETGPFETGPLETGALDTGAVETGTLRTVLSAETLTQRELFVYHSVRSEGALLGGVTITMEHTLDDVFRWTSSQLPRSPSRPPPPPPPKIPPSYPTPLHLQYFPPTPPYSACSVTTSACMRPHSAEEVKLSLAPRSPYVAIPLFV